MECEGKTLGAVVSLQSPAKSGWWLVVVGRWQDLLGAAACLVLTELPVEGRASRPSAGRSIEVTAEIVARHVHGK